MMRILTDNSYLSFLIIMGSTSLDKATAKLNDLALFCYDEHSPVSIENVRDFISTHAILSKLSIRLSPTRRNALAPTAKTLITTDDYLTLYNDAFYLEAILHNTNLRNNLDTTIETGMSNYIHTQRGIVEISRSLLLISRQLTQEITLLLHNHSQQF